jgi:hypothetical protein
MNVVRSQWTVVSNSDVCLVLCAMLFALCSPAEAQQAKTLPRVGVIK